jgi:hypothetical protein
MARGPRGERRPDDPAQAAVRAVQIALGETDEAIDESATRKDPAAVSLGRRGGLKGGRRRAETLTADVRREIAKKAAAARWGRDG